MSKVRIFSGEDVVKALGMREAIDVVRDAFIQLSTQQAVVPVRMNLEMSKEKGRTLIMPVYLQKNRQVGVKVVTLMDENSEQGLPFIHAMLMVMDAGNGKPLALMNGEYLTALRTGAASGLATDLLARKNAEVAAIIGAGVQGRFQLEAICQVRNIKHAFVLNRNFQKAAVFGKEMSDKLSYPIEASTSTDILKEADIICTATTSQTAVFSHDNLKPGVHINGIGSYKPGMCEVPSETVCAAKVVVDHRDSCLSEAGDLIQPLQKGLINENHIYAEIGEVAAGLKKGRETDTEITFFKSVGNAVQDLAAASRVIVNAEKLGLGTEVHL